MDVPMTIEDLEPFRTYSLRQFNAKAQELLREDHFEGLLSGVPLHDAAYRRNVQDKNEAIADSIKFVILGHECVEGHTARLDLLKNFISEPWAEANVVVRRDYDSLIGYGDNLPYRRALEVYPIPSFRDTLTSNVHIKKKFTIRTRGQERVSDDSI